MDRMAEISYETDPGLPEYIRNIFRANCCGALAPVNFLDAGGPESRLHMVWNSSGSTSFFGGLASFRPSDGLTDRFCRILQLLRRVTEGICEAEDYLVPWKYLNLEPEYVFFDDRNDRVLFLPGRKRDGEDAVPASSGEECCGRETCGTFLGCLTDLCCFAETAFPGCGAERIAEKLAEENLKKVLGAGDMLRILSLWEMELRQ